MSLAGVKAFLCIFRSKDMLSCLQAAMLEQIHRLRSKSFFTVNLQI